MAGFCTACGWRVKRLDGVKLCPQCGSTRAPCDDADQVVVSINWHELRVLCTWAESWAIRHIEKTPVAVEQSSGRGTVYAIADRIQRQCPEMKTPLTLSGEINGMRDVGMDVRTNIPGEER